jgi:hypothetical protein
MTSRVVPNLIACLTLLLAGCRTPGRRAAGRDGAAVSGRVRFVDVTREAGIRFRHRNGAFGRKYMPETTGSGCAFFDADGDGWLDLLAINGTDWPDHRTGSYGSALYHNRGDGTFVDVTRGAGLPADV